MEFDNKGAMSGAATGAMVGSAAMPGIGTAVGAGAGLLVGGFLGPMLNGSSDDELYRAREEQTRAKLGQFTNILGNWAQTGQGPSAAQQMVQRNRAENASNQVAMAKTMGGDNALANRQAAEGIARGNAEASYQGQVLRAQEQQAAIQNYLRAMESQRALDQRMYGVKTGRDTHEAEKKSQFYGNMLNEGAKMYGGSMNGGTMGAGMQQSGGFF